VSLTGVCLVFEQGLPWLLWEHATQYQDTAFKAADWGFKTGLGVLIGLGAGKRV